MTKITKTETGWNKKPHLVEYSIRYVIRSISADGLIKVPENVSEYETFNSPEDALAECARIGIEDVYIMTKVQKYFP